MVTSERIEDISRREEASSSIGRIICIYGIESPVSDHGRESEKQRLIFDWDCNLQIQDWI